MLDVEDGYHEPAAALVRRASVGSTIAAALDLTLYEVANVGVRRFGEAQSNELVGVVERLCASNLVRVGPALIREASALAARHGLTVYDASYVAAARSHGWQLVSCDVKDLVEPGFAVAPDAVA